MIAEIQDSIFKAIDVIIEKRLQSMKANYCIVGIINSSPLNDDKGEQYFNIGYQDSTIKAYPINSNMNISIGDLVYVLLINGDISKKRIILAKV